MRRVTASADGFLFGQGQQPFSMALPPGRLVEPKDADVQPTPIGFPQQAAENCPVRRAQKDSQRLVAVVRRIKEIVGLQPLLNETHILRRGCVFERDGESLL